MGAAGRIRLFSRLFFRAAGHDAQPADSRRQAALPAIAPGGTTSRAGFRPPGNADPGGRFAFLPIAALCELAALRADQQNPIDSASAAVLRRGGTAQVDSLGDAASHARR